MIERLLIGLINASVAGGFSILVFCYLSWVFRRKYGAKSRKNGWILIAVCILLPLNLVPLPYTYTIRLPNLVMQEKTERSPNMGSDAPQPEQKTNAEIYTIQNEVHEAKISTEKILFLFWFAGMMILTVYHLTAYRKMCRKVKRWSHDLQDETVQKTAEDIAAEIGLKKIPKLRIIEADGPFTMGITKTIVCIPNEDFLEKDLYYILKHELIHCKERDILWKLLFLTVNIIHWFNPFVWLMQRLAENDMEQVCDEVVLKNSSREERREYSEIIMAWVEKSGHNQSPVSTGYMTGMVFLKWRFANIYYSGHKANGAVLFGAMCIVMLLLGGAVDIKTNETIYRTDSIPIDFGVSSMESRTDLNGDGKEDKVRVIDMRDGDAAYTQIVANVNGMDVAVKNYDGYYASTVVTGDLSGNGKADVVLVRGVYTSNYGAVEVSILHLEGTKWVEYPYNFIHNPNTSIEQPVSFEAEESWHNGDLYIEGATIFEKNGKTMVRLIQLLPEEDDETVNVIDASYREKGWYIEDIWTVHNFYSGDRFRKILAPGDS